MTAEANLGLHSAASRARARYFREDFDGSHHVDLFEFGENAPETYWGDAREIGEIDGTAFRDASITYIDRIFSSPPPAVAAEKYAWLARYFFEKCESNLWPLPNNLPISEKKRVQYEAELRDALAADAQGD